MPRTKTPGSIKPCLKNGNRIKDEQGRTKYELQYYDATGRKRHRKQYFHTTREARLYIAAERGEKTAPKSWSYVLKEWIRNTTATDGYISQVAKTVTLLTDRIGDTGIEAVTPLQMREYLDWRRENPSGAAARKDQRHLLALARWARSQVMIESIPWEHLAKPAHKQKQRRPVPLDQIWPLLDRLDAWTRPIAEWITLTGMRQQDAATLEESDIEAGRALVRIKGGEDVDYVLDDDLMRILDAAKALKEQAGINSYWIFCNSKGNRWTPQHLSHRIRDQWPDGITLHCLRHTFATEAGKMFGADMVQAGLAHKSRATSEIYSHVAEDAQARHQVGVAVRRVLQNTREAGKQNTNRTQVQKRRSETDPDKTKQNKVEVEINGQKVLIPKALADEMLNSYSEGR